jgi:D-glycero-D-manno-heptose 1,7-bisphosphate phosphatase
VIINVDRGYIHRSDQFEFVPGIFDLARFWTNELRRPIVVVTNQSGIDRGYFDENAYADLTRWMCDRFEAEHTAITRVYHCPYHPLDAIGEYRCDHPWRKPKPGMLLQAVSDLGLDPARCAIPGDKMSDMESWRGGRDWAARSHRAARCQNGVVGDLGEALALFRSRFAPTVPDQRSGIPDVRRFKLELGFAAVRWSRRAAVCPRLTVVRPV